MEIRLDDQRETKIADLRETTYADHRKTTHTGQRERRDSLKGIQDYNALIGSIAEVVWD